MRPVARPWASIAPEQQEDVARAYERAPTFQNSAVPAFHAMREETSRQFDRITAPRSKGGRGISVSVTRDDPYGAGDTSGNNRGVARMFHDIANNRHLDVLSSAETGGHPIFSDDENNMFRAVHDYNGHFATGRGFDRHGEEAAYQAHARMYSPLARQALATETRGQNAANVLRGNFAEQKVATIGAERPLRQITAPQRMSANLQAMQFHLNAGLPDPHPL